MSANLQNLIAQRKSLVAAEHDTYSPEHFPGSKLWFAQRVAETARREFDAAHPEVLEAMRAAAKQPSYVSDPSSLYNRALRGED